jgi:hypothetical protein
MERKRNAYKIFGGKTRRKERSKKTCAEIGVNIKTGLKEVELEDVNWIHLAHDRDHYRAHMNTVINFRVP